MQDITESPEKAEKHKFILFVTGMSVKSGNAVVNLRKICDKYIEGGYELEIVDISRNKEKAVEFQIIAIPTLVKIFPEPRRILLGDLSNTEKLLKLLNIEID